MKNALTLDHIYKRFTDDGRKRIEVLEDINLTITEGEFFVILGPSGSGKSTRVRIMSRLDEPSSGKVLYGEGIAASDIGFVFQQFALLPWLTVHENIELNLIGHGVPEARRKEIVHRELAEFHLEKFAHAY